LVTVHFARFRCGVNDKFDHVGVVRFFDYVAESSLGHRVLKMMFFVIELINFNIRNIIEVFISFVSLQNLLTKGLGHQ